MRMEWVVRFDSRLAARAIVTAISFLALCLAIFGAGFLGTWETATYDLWLRWRYLSNSRSERSRQAPVSLIAVDARTEQVHGRFGAGQWLSRGPFIRQLRILEKCFHPSILAYDILFQENLSTTRAGTSRVSEDSARLHRIAREIEELAKDPLEILSHQSLTDMNVLSFEQGSDSMVHQLASIAANKSFPVLFSFYFRGFDESPDHLMEEAYQEYDVPTTENEERRTAIRYLMDLSIPDADVHSAGTEELGLPTPSWSHPRFPSRDLLDYAFLGSINARPDPDGIIRRLPIVLRVSYMDAGANERREACVPSFSLMACLVHWGVEFPLRPGAMKVFWGKEIVVRTRSCGMVRIPIDAEGQILLDYAVQVHDVPCINFATLSSTDPSSREAILRLQKRFHHLIDNRIVLVAVISAGVDTGATPLSASTPLVLAHFTAISSMLQGQYLTPLERRGRALVMGIVFAVFTGICLLVRSAKLGIIVIILACTYFLAGYLCIHARWIVLPVMSPLLYAVLCTLGTLSYRFFVEERAKMQIRGMFSRMVSEKVLTYLEDNPESLGLSGRTVEATVFFSDVTNFTRISEYLSPEKLTELMNAYLTPVTECVLRHGGYLDKYVGDGVMAVWGVPYPDPAHATAACRAAIEQLDLVRDLNATAGKSLNVTVRVRMGINSGLVTAGNMGSNRRFQYTVLGDVVNLAARLEGLNKEIGTDILIGENTRQLISNDLAVRRIGRIVVVGRSEGIMVYALEGQKEAMGKEMLQIIEMYESALESYLRRDWDASIRLTREILKIQPDAPSSFLQDRAIEALSRPPSNDWQGEFVQTHKG